VDEIKGFIPHEDIERAYIFKLLSSFKIDLRPILAKPYIALAIRLVLVTLSILTLTNSPMLESQFMIITRL